MWPKSLLSLVKPKKLIRKSGKRMSIAVNVRLFGGSSRDRRTILLKEDSRNLRALLKLLAKEKATSYIEDGCVVTINKMLITEDVELKDKDEIRIMPMLHGG